ncbi:class I SAM-dependent methyltransferase (plasmid) [Halorientalis pallida]|uniref:class I SAM-dependent methyltransferase n=1 Tax=Halorientalis pallida TaxID=2479928 RepID=UPI003C6F664A
MAEGPKTITNRVSSSSDLPTAAERKQWDQEYTRHKAIPSSDRDDPSRALIAADGPLEYESIDVAVDVGCGNGRNTVYLANKGIDVLALDFSTEAVARTKERLAHSTVSGSVDVLLADATAGLPVADQSADLIVDSYFSCHILKEATLDAYFTDVRRSLVPDGQFYWSGLGVEDEYYQSIADSHPGENMIVDPLNDIPKKLYNARNLVAELPFGDVPTVAIELLFEDEVAGNSYQRSIVSAVFNN